MTHRWQQLLDLEIDRCFAQLVQLRRHLHQHPELSGEEQETSLHLYTLLGDEGYAVQLGAEGLGVLADWPEDQRPADGSLLALRGDLDALRIQDQKQVAYRSCRPGVMHACGHDVHTTVVYGVLHVLRRLALAQQLPWPIALRGIFQPAEETCRGARQMIESGALEGVAAILATHVDPTLNVGQLGFRDGVLTANCDELSVEIVGRGGHAARPHESKDPITAAAHLINALYLHIARLTDSQDAVVVTIGQISGGDNPNVIPEKAQLHGTIRTLDARVRDDAVRHLRRIVEGVAEITETQMELCFGRYAPAVVNDRRITRGLRQIAHEVVGSPGVHEIPRPSMGSEDFAFYLKQVPGCLMRVGCTPAGEASRGLHTPQFDVDEDAIRVAVRVLARAVLYWFAPPRADGTLSSPFLQIDHGQADFQA